MGAKSDSRLNLVVIACVAPGDRTREFVSMAHKRNFVAKAIGSAQKWWLTAIFSAVYRGREGRNDADAQPRRLYDRWPRAGSRGYRSACAGADPCGGAGRAVALPHRD